MTDVVRPRRGLILAEVPAEGAAIPAALAEEWTANRMVVPSEPTPAPRRHMGALVREYATGGVVGPMASVLVGESGPEAIPIKAPVRRRRRKAAPAARKRSSK